MKISDEVHEAASRAAEDAAIVVPDLATAALLLGRAIVRWREKADSAARRDHANRLNRRQEGRRDVREQQPWAVQR